MPNSNLTLFDLTGIDFNSFIVRREWQHIDLLVYSETANLVIAIENKIWSKESKHQLNKYQDIVENEFADYNQIFLFLTPDGDEANNNENWLTINYPFVLDILEKAFKLKEKVIIEPTKHFILQYKEIIRRHIVGDKELEGVCRRIYFKHQKALDLIFEHKPDIYSDIASHLEEKIKGNSQLICDTSGKTYVRFISNATDKVIPKLGQGWTSTKRILLFEFQNRNNILALKLILGPGNSEVRKTIYETAVKNQRLFKNIRKTLTVQFTQLYHLEILPKNYEDKYESMDEIIERIDTVFDRFLDNDFIEIERIIQSLEY